MAAIRKLPEHCQFGVFLDQALRDMLVCGLKNAAVQKGQLAHAKLELNKALEIALSIKMAEKQALAMKTDVQNVDPEVKLLKVDRGRTGQRRAATTTGPKGQDGGRQCWRYNGAHNPRVCCFKTEICHNCGMRGVYAEISTSKK